MGALLQLGFLVFVATTLVFADDLTDIKNRKKAIGIFNVVQFENAACESTTVGMNGTCYTSEECSSRDGTASGSCAEGYGVCCTFSLACGGSSSENNTFLVQTTSMSPSVSPAGSGTCAYTICPTTTDINRIRLDLTTFSIAVPTAPCDLSGDAAACTENRRDAVGHCLTDSFDVTGAPTICGFNTGQHMIVDTDGTECITAVFAYSGSTTSRLYNIKVTQYDKSESMNLAGQAGCLQYMTGTTGLIKSFNWNGVGTGPNGPTSTHLANQNYKACVRQNSGYCYICWTPEDDSTDRGSFGLSNGGSDADAAKSGVDATCPNIPNTAIAIDSADYVVIPGGSNTADPATNAATTTAARGVNRICGRLFNGENALAAVTTVCTRRTPFMLGFVTDNYEAATDNGNAKANVNEAADGATAGTYSSPLGTIGFSLHFAQIAC